MPSFFEKGKTQTARAKRAAENTPERVSILANAPEERNRGTALKKRFPERSRAYGARRGLHREKRALTRVLKNNNAGQIGATELEQERSAWRT